MYWGHSEGTLTQSLAGNKRLNGSALTPFLPAIVSDTYQ